jgi:hypothetical protein
MSIKEGTSEIVFACCRPPPSLMVTGNPAVKDNAIADPWRVPPLSQSQQAADRSEAINAALTVSSRYSSYPQKIGGPSWSRTSDQWIKRRRFCRFGATERQGLKSLTGPRHVHSSPSLTLGHEFW